MDRNRNEVELIETSEYGNTDINAIIGNDRDFAFEDSESFAQHGFSKQEFNQESGELETVEEEPDDFDEAVEFFDDVDDEE